MHGDEDVEELEIDCPECSGDGYLDNGRLCPACRGGGAVPASFEDK